MGGGGEMGERGREQLDDKVKSEGKEKVMRQELQNIRYCMMYSRVSGSIVIASSRE